MREVGTLGERRLHRRSLSLAARCEAGIGRERQHAAKLASYWWGLPVVASRYF